MPTLDTLGAKKQLTDAGLPDDQAEAIVNAMFGFLTAELATKADLETVRADLKAEMAELESRLTNRLYATVIGGIGFLSILVTLFEFLG